MFKFVVAILAISVLAQASSAQEKETNEQVYHSDCHLRHDHCLPSSTLTTNVDFETNKRIDSNRNLYTNGMFNMNKKNKRIDSKKDS